MNNAQHEPEIFPADPRKTYALMELVRGTTPSVDKGPEDTVMSWPNLVLLVTLLTLGTTLVILVMSVFLNVPLREIANPDVTENPAKAPWYFLSLQELLLHMDPTVAGVFVPTLVILALLALPYLDNSHFGIGTWFTSPRGARICAWTALGTALLLPVLVLLDRPMVMVEGNLLTLRNALAGSSLVATVVIPLGALGLPLAVLLASLWRIRASAREVALALFTVFVVAVVILTLIGVYFRGPGMQLFWPWEMPAAHQP